MPMSVKSVVAFVTVCMIAKGCSWWNAGIENEPSGLQKSAITGAVNWKNFAAAKIFLTTCCYLYNITFVYSLFTAISLV